MRDLTGKVFGRLSALRVSGKTKQNGYKWECKCECGSLIDVASTHLVTGHTKSCGCLRAEAMSATMKKHGRSGGTEHNIWLSMLARCNNPKSHAYARYGGRGIKVCERWHKFENFFLDMGERPEGCSIDRIDNSRGYEPDNCRWATSRQQGRNTRVNRMATYNGQTMTLIDLAESKGIPYKLLHGRLAAGWELNKAVETPSRRTTQSAR